MVRDRLCRLNKKRLSQISGLHWLWRCEVGVIDIGYRYFTAVSSRRLLGPFGIKSQLLRATFLRNCSVVCLMLRRNESLKFAVNMAFEICHYELHIHCNVRWIDMRSLKISSALLECWYNSSATRDMLLKATTGLTSHYCAVQGVS
jgi:hypothetical protein